MSSEKLIEDIVAGDLVILKGRRQKDKKRAAIILKVLTEHDRYFIESTTWTEFKYMVYSEGKTIYVTEGHIYRVINAKEEEEL